MTLTAGTRVGPYEVVAPIGVGGMGEVYRARDAKLGRDVAIKVLPAAFADDPQRLTRFEREARTLAALSHPNIAQIYGLETVHDTRPPFTALVMELVGGDDLAARIARGPIPLDEALRIARQIAAALEAAHERAIVHRDLKPANIKVRGDGIVKVLDFGLAKAADAAGGDGSADTTVDHMNSPTITSHATERGVVLGTAAYMAPEQARGRAVDRRADLWAFGVVLYEMLTGRRAFEGADVHELLASVLRDQPPYEALPADTPAAIRRLLRRCLEKDPANRLDSMAAARLEIDDALASPDGDRAPTTVVPPAAVRWRVVAAAFAAGITVLAAGAGAAWRLTSVPEIERPVARFAIPWPDGDVLNAMNLPAVAVSRDGRRVVYRTRQAIFVRDLAATEPRQIARVGVSGVWLSPDGESILFRTPLGFSRVAANGGSPEPVVAEPSVNGATWAGDGNIIYSTTRGIFSVPESGGTPRLLIRPSVEHAELAAPQVLPTGRLLYTEWRGDGSSTEGGTIISNRDGSNASVLLEGRSARYLPNGFLLYGAEGRAYVVPFDLERERITGQPVAVPDTVIAPQSNWAQIDVSANGTAAFISTHTNEIRTVLAWTDAAGRSAPAVNVPRVYSDLRLSPDGRRVAVHLWDEDNDVWVADLVRGVLTRVTFSPEEEETPVWSPDGRELAFASGRELRTPAGSEPPSRALVRKPADGGASAPETIIWSSPDHFHVNDWSPDGRTIVVEARRAGTLNDLVAIDVATGDARPIAASTFRERQARFSPDGRWMAFTSNESGIDEVYVQPFPSLSNRVIVSTGGGQEPVWSRDGRHLYFRAGGQMFSATVTGSLEFSPPTPMFPDTFVRTQGDGHTHYDVDANSRFLVIATPPSSTERGQVHVVLNWDEQLVRVGR